MHAHTISNTCRSCSIIIVFVSFTFLFCLFFQRFNEEYDMSERCHFVACVEQKSRKSTKRISLVASVKVMSLASDEPFVFTGKMPLNSVNRIFLVHSKGVPCWHRHSPCCRCRYLWRTKTTNSLHNKSMQRIIFFWIFFYFSHLVLRNLLVFSVVLKSRKKHYAISRLALKNELFLSCFSDFICVFFSLNTFPPNARLNVAYSFATNKCSHAS